MKELFSIYLLFLKIGCVIFGGGYTILPFLKAEVVEKRKWITENELFEYFSVAQCSPGIIAANVSVFIGYKQRKFFGGFFALLGIITPPVVIISLISLYFDEITANPYALKIFKGLNIGVMALLISTFINMAKKSFIDVITFLFFIFCVSLILFCHIQFVSVILIAIGVGLIKYYSLRGKQL